MLSCRQQTQTNMAPMPLEKPDSSYFNSSDNDSTDDKENVVEQEDDEPLGLNNQD